MAVPVAKMGSPVSVHAVCSVLGDLNLILYPKRQYSEVQRKQDGAKDAVSPNERKLGEKVAGRNAFAELNK